MRCGLSVSMVPRRVSWWSLMQFYKASGPHSRVVAVMHPELYGWDLAAFLIAKSAGIDTPGGTTESQTNQTTVKRIGTPVDRSTLDEWFFANG